jgi:hypothetical protein
MEMGMTSKILQGMRDAVGFAKGDKSKGSVTVLHVRNGVNDEPLLDAASAHALTKDIEVDVRRNVRQHQGALESGATPLEAAARAYEKDTGRPCDVEALEGAIGVYEERAGVENEAALKRIFGEAETLESIGGELLAGSGFENETPTA